jgi:hypothetical protein
MKEIEIEERIEKYNEKRGVPLTPRWSPDNSPSPAVVCPQDWDWWWTEEELNMDVKYIIWLVNPLLVHSQFWCNPDTVITESCGTPPPVQIPQGLHKEPWLSIRYFLHSLFIVTVSKPFPTLGKSPTL